MHGLSLSDRPRPPAPRPRLGRRATPRAPARATRNFASACVRRRRCHGTTWGVAGIRAETGRADAEIVDRRRHALFCPAHPHFGLRCAPGAVSGRRRRHRRLGRTALATRLCPARMLGPLAQQDSVHHEDHEGNTESSVVAVQGHPARAHTIALSEGGVREAAPRHGHQGRHRFGWGATHPAPLLGPRTFHAIYGCRPNDLMACCVPIMPWRVLYISLPARASCALLERVTSGAASSVQDTALEASRRLAVACPYLPRLLVFEIRVSLYNVVSSTVAKQPVDSV